MGANTINYTAVGNRIRMARKKSGWQQSELAFRAGLTSAHLSHIETGCTKVSLPAIVSIANALNTSLDMLVFDSMMRSSVVYNKMFAEELSDCNEIEVRILYDLLRMIKSAIRDAKTVRIDESSED